MPPPITRREFLKAAGAASLGVSGCSDGPKEVTQLEPRALPRPEDSGIDHVVVLMMENRSFDHFLGWVPGADGRQAGILAPDRAGVLQSTYAMLEGHASPWQGCGSADPNHGYGAGRVHLNAGKMDGWLLTDPTQLGDTLPLGYYRRQDLPFYSAAVEDWTVCDRYHHALIAGTWPNRFYMHGGDNDFVDGDGIEKQSHIPTLWDALAEKGLQGRYYFGNLPFVALWGTKYLTMARPLETFFLDAALGDLAPVTFVDPIFESGAPNALSNDDHPHSDVRAGQFLLNRVYNAVRSSPKWDRTLLIINYDEWGGFFEHVVPPVMPPSEVDFATWQNDGLLGFRVPCMLIGPRAFRGHVNHDLLEPNAVLNFLSWRFGLKPIGSRAQYAGNLATALNWGEPRYDTRGYSVPAGEFGLDCQRFSSFPQINPPGPTGITLPDLPRLAAQDETHVRQMRGLFEKARDLGFWTGPVVFPPQT